MAKTETGKYIITSHTVLNNAKKQAIEDTSNDKDLTLFIILSVEKYYVDDSSFCRNHETIVGTCTNGKFEVSKE